MATEGGILATIRQKLSPDGQRFLDGMSTDERRILEDIAKAEGVEYVVSTWGNTENQVEFIRSL